MLPFVSITQTVNFNTPITSIDSINTITATQSLNPLKNKLSDKRIIGIGEATHGSREFILAKSKFFLFLNQELTVTDLAIEMPFSIGPAITDYLNDKVPFTYIDSLLKPAKAIYSEEFVTFLNTLKELNRTKDEQQKIRIWGVDLDQYYDYAILQLRSIAGVAQLKTFNEIAIAIPQNYKMIRSYSKEYTTPEIWTAIKKIDTLFQPLIMKLSPVDAFIAKGCLRQLYNSYTFFQGKSSFEYRDQQMADNINEVVSLIGNKKLMLWAHNLHIQKHYLGVKLLGERLAEKYDDAYVAIGSIFKEGQYRVWYKGVLSIKQLPAETSGALAMFLSTAGVKNYVVFTSDLTPFFKKEKVEIHNVGILQTLDKPHANKATLYTFKSFDALLYFDTLTALKLYN